MMSTLSVPTLQLGDSQAVLELQDKHSPASLPVPNSTHSFWIDTPGANPLAKEGSQGKLITDADICIIGSGITGVSTAYHFAKLFRERDYNDSIPSLKVAILEARDFCSGATGRNGGHLTPQQFDDFCRRQLVYGTEEAKKTYMLESYTTTEIVKIIAEEQLEGIIDFVSSSRITLLVTEKEVEDARRDYTAAKAAGLELPHVEFRSKEKMASAYGVSYPAVSYPGHNLWPLKLVTQLYNLARSLAPLKLTFTLHTNTPVSSITPVSPISTAQTSDSKSRRWSLVTPRGLIKCSYVIHATNAYASYLLHHMHGPAGIIPTRGQVMALRASTPASEITTSSWVGNEGFEYWFPRPIKGENASDNISQEDLEKPLIILGGGREVTGPEFEYYVTDDSVVRKDVGQALRKFLPGLFPGKYEEREPEMEWTGIMGFSKIGDPFVGPIVGPPDAGAVGYEGQYIAAGYTGHGMTRAYACAEAVAGMVVADMMGENWSAPQWLPRHYLTTERPSLY